MGNDPARSGWPEGVGRRVLERVDSTNAEALRQAPQLSGPTWIMTRRQEAGRGRRGRVWTMPEGNFAASLFFRPHGGAAEAARYSFVAALALHDALIALGGPTLNLSLKWPNDVLLNGGKLAGILLESAGASGQRIGALVVGVGVNLAAAPDLDAIEARALRPVSLRGETGLVIDPEDLLDALAVSFERGSRQMRDYGFAPIRAAWLARAAKLGETIIARTGTAEIEGRFETIDAEGALILVTPRGRQAIPAADIFFERG